MRNCGATMEDLKLNSSIKKTIKRSNKSALSTVEGDGPSLMQVAAWNSIVAEQEAPLDAPLRAALKKAHAATIQYNTAVGTPKIIATLRRRPALRRSEVSSAFICNVLAFILNWKQHLREEDAHRPYR